MVQWINMFIAFYEEKRLNSGELNWEKNIVEWWTTIFSAELDIFSPSLRLEEIFLSSAN